MRGYAPAFAKPARLFCKLAICARLEKKGGFPPCVNVFCFILFLVVVASFTLVGKRLFFLLNSLDLVVIYHLHTRDLKNASITII